MMIGGDTDRVVTDEDREAYKADGPCGLIGSIVRRTRCAGSEAVEIARKWIDSLRKPVDEEAFSKANERVRAACLTQANAGPSQP